MAISVFTSVEQITDSAGDIAPGATVTVYAAGTTTPLSVYSDPDLDISHIAANPIVCDSAGRHDMRYIAATAYKVLVKNSAGVTIFPRDNIDPGVPLGSGALAIANGGTGAITAAAAIAALGGATSAEVADIAAQVASVTGALGSTAKTHIATGTTAQRDSIPTAGDFRRNTTTSRWEGYVAAWENFFTDTEIASQAEAEAGSINTRVMTPLRFAQALTALSPRVLLATLTASASASLADTTNLTSAYSRYELVFTNIIPATNAVSCRLRVNVGGVQTTSYDGTVLGVPMPILHKQPSFHAADQASFQAPEAGLAGRSRFTIHRKRPRLKASTVQGSIGMLPLLDISTSLSAAHGPDRTQP
jgi:hypothetical protein